jgi:integrase
VKKVPEKHKGQGIFVRCLKCKWQVKDECKLTGKHLSTCKYKDKHKYELLVHLAEDRRRQKILHTENFDEVLIENVKFRAEMKANRGNNGTLQTREKIKTNLFDLIVEYLDNLDGKNPIIHLNIPVAKRHRTNIALILKRFATSLRDKGYNLKYLDAKDVTDIEVDIFNRYVLSLDLAHSTYNAHLVGLKTFYNWIIDKKDYKINNPFKHTSLQFNTDKEVQIITQKEFNSLLGVVTPENGYMFFKNPNARQKGKYMYRDYLVMAFKLALETGCRREELVELKWNFLRVLPDGAECLYINNLKVNRIKTSKAHGKFKRPIPITNSLRTLLNEMGLNEKAGKDEYIIERPKGVSAMKFAENISRAFNHYIKLVDTGNRKIEFMDLRKTYITFLTLKLGNKAKIFTGHASDDILIDSYLAKEYIAGDLSNFNMFEGKKSEAI